MRIDICLVVLVAIAVAATTQTQFAGQSVIQVLPNNQSHSELFWGLVEKENIDIWSGALHHVRVSPSQAQVIRKAGFNTKPVIEDVQKLVDEFVDKQKGAFSKPDAEFFDAYHEFEDIVQWVEMMAGQYSQIMNIESVGQTHGNRPIISAVIHGEKQPVDVPGVVFLGGAHAREWISPMTTLWVIKELCEGYANDPVIKLLVDEIQFLIVPVANPDGYEYTWQSSSTRLWRKNREPTSNPSCFGVDTNRNWPFQWNTGGSSSNPCSDIYHGPSAGSTAEVKALTAYINDKPYIAGFIDFHAYSQLYMSPWGYTRQLPTRYSDMKGAMDDGAAKIRQVHGKIYQTGSIANIIYVASGGSVDWTLGVKGITWSFALELRDTGTYGFLLPPDQIVPQGEEIMPAVISFGQVVLEEFSQEKLNNAA